MYYTCDYNYIIYNCPANRNANHMRFHSKALGLGIRFQVKLIDLRKKVGLPGY